MAKIPFQHWRTSHDVNGNPRRAFVVYDPENGGITVVAEEGYLGRPIQLNYDPYVELPPVDIGPARYRKLLKDARKSGVLVEA